MTKKSKILGILPALSILLISTCAFVPSFLVSGLNDRLDNRTQDLSNNQMAYNWVTDEARYIFNHDSSLYTMAWQQINEAQRLDLEFSNLVYANQTDELTNMTYGAMILSHLNSISIMMDQTISFAIHMHFNATENAFFEFGVSPSGYLYGVPRIAWEQKPVYIKTTVDHFIKVLFGDWYSNPGEKLFSQITMDLLETNFTVDLQSPFSFLFAIDTVYTLDTASNLYNLTQTQLLDLQAEIEYLVFQINDLDTIIGNMQMIISIMTVATLLATAVSGRLEERKLAHKISLIRSDIKEDESIIVSEVDKFSVIILIFAVVIALAGLLYAFWPL
ncbi:MAG: hypothetical protein FK734_03150 [Asgard group archaeon]|nr:hypothetical protein [Asgard group archaeon]